MNKDHEKKIYLLWWRFLKENDEYKDLCRSLREDPRKVSDDLIEKYRGYLERWGDIHKGGYDFEQWWSWQHGLNKPNVRELKETISDEIDATIRYLLHMKKAPPTVWDLKNSFLTEFTPSPESLYVKIDLSLNRSKTDMLKEISKGISKIVSKYYDADWLTCEHVENNYFHLVPRNNSYFVIFCFTI